MKKLMVCSLSSDLGGILSLSEVRLVILSALIFSFLSTESWLALTNLMFLITGICCFFAFDTVSFLFFSFYSESHLELLFMLEVPMATEDALLPEAHASSVAGW
jgi:hypothetical protein